jgi:hypothetical protein
MKYTLGHGDLYFDAWTDMTAIEQTAATELMLQSAATARGSGSAAAAEERSLNADYICAAKMHESHHNHGQIAFFSHQFQYYVCGTPLQIEKIRGKNAWQHRCPKGPPSTTVGADARKWPRSTASTYFKIFKIESYQPTIDKEGWLINSY